MTDTIAPNWTSSITKLNKNVVVVIGKKVCCKKTRGNVGLIFRGHHSTDGYNGEMQDKVFGKCVVCIVKSNILKLYNARQPL